MSSINTTIDQINAASAGMVVFLSVINFVPGLIGVVFNLIVFTRPTLRQEPCSLYFFASTCLDLYVILVIIPVRIVSNGYNLDWANYNIAVCKLEFYGFHVPRSISCWIVLMACIDRYLHSSINIRFRRFSSLKTARIAIGIITILMPLLYIHMVIFFTIYNGRDPYGNVIPVCNGQKGFYQAFMILWHMFMYSICPTFLTLLFGCLTVRNIHQGRQVVPVVVGENNRSARRSNSQLLRILIIQVIIIVIATLPYSLVRFYISITSNIVKDGVQIAKENLALQTFNSTTYFAHSSGFYLYTLLGSVFRKEVVKIITRHFPHFRRRRNQVSIANQNN
ncbi:unnamed protein product [Adineta steineri]|uniref:G-protein coupled receptors family 1 profile domain-containing protein n=1 Tax=Adineta steineri TaxID=433720 RepID=A0A818X210_9BILA|nr:unnamed protein product [Adineta steineri]CAF3731564.1 unnamed protein product [Adineta steineri]